MAAGGPRVVQQVNLQDGALQGKHHVQQQLLQQRHDQEQQLLQHQQHQQLQQLQQQRQRQLLQQQGSRGSEGATAGAPPMYTASPSNTMPSKAGLGPTPVGQPGGSMTYGGAVNTGQVAGPSQQKFVGQASSYTQQQR
eukprot:TRINITY_DN4508_c0_g1_i1.p1 TRINITY_DN4508_c0_g1~~TRINITY_DN4508_c0_g1_i1.p1  ORF type:complete len:147 (+),score=34.59 TRINITY_DN4508_c0_g1_i1:30-443(+)